MEARRIARHLVGISVLATALVGAPTAQASLSWDATSHDFGSQNVGTSVSKTFTLTAMCDAGGGVPPAMVCISPVHTFGAPTVTGDGFSLGGLNTCVVGTLVTTTFPGVASCVTTVVFTPASAGTKTGALNTSGPDVALSGTGVSPSTPTTPQAPTTTPTDSGDSGQNAKKKCKKKRKRGAAAAKKCKKKRK